MNANATASSANTSVSALRPTKTRQQLESELRIFNLGYALRMFSMSPARRAYCFTRLTQEQAKADFQNIEPAA